MNRHMCLAFTLLASTAALAFGPQNPNPGIYDCQACYNVTGPTIGLSQNCWEVSRDILADAKNEAIRRCIIDGRMNPNTYRPELIEYTCKENVSCRKN